MAAHMADDHGIDRIQLAFEIGQIDAIVIADLAQHGDAFGMHHRRRNGGKGKGGDHHAGIAGQAKRLECDEQSGRAARYRQRVFHAKCFGEFLFQQSDRAVFWRRVSKQIAGLKQSINFGTGLGRDRFCIVHIRSHCWLLTVLNHL